MAVQLQKDAVHLRTTGAVQLRIWPMRDWWKRKTRETNGFEEYRESFGQ